MMRNRSDRTEIAEEAARILFLTYGHDAVQMAGLRCVELAERGDKAGSASWKEILGHVRKLATANPQGRGTIN